MANNQSNKTSLYIAIGLGVILIVIVGLLFVNGGDDETARETASHQTSQASPDNIPNNHPQTTDKDQSQSAQPDNDHGQTTPSTLPVNWSQLTSAQQATLNPYDCNVDAQYIRSDTGRCSAKPLFTEDQQWHDAAGQLHRDGDQPAVIEYDENGQVKLEEWYQYGQLHRDGDLPAKISSCYTCRIRQIESWYQHGQLHRDGDQPAKILYDDYTDSNKIPLEEWYQHGQLHRDGDRPAVRGGCSFYENDEVEWCSDGGWYQHGQRHRDGDRPASISSDGSLILMYWYQDGEQHRDDSKPAEIECDPNQLMIGRWYQNDEQQGSDKSASTSSEPWSSAEDSELCEEVRDGSVWDNS